VKSEKWKVESEKCGEGQESGKWKVESVARGKRKVKSEKLEVSKQRLAVV
jgi:hypothetical protein